MTGWKHLIAASVAALAVAGSAFGVGIQVQLEEVMAGANGLNKVQFIEIKMQSAGDNLWGPQGIETTGRLKLTFFDATGAQTGEYVFPSDPAVGPVDPTNGGYSVLVATTAFAALPGAPTPDFVIPPSVLAVDGKVRLGANPANPNAPELNLALSYGNFVGSTETDTLGQPAGPPAAVLPIVDAQSMRRSANHGNYGTGQYNADFSVQTAAPRNSAGGTVSITTLSNIEQGHNLFTFETFNGNGRTCHTCHRPDDAFGVSPTKIGFLKPHDHLFIAEWNPTLSALENPCLMRSARGLILENIDGFQNPPVFRGIPHLENLSLTAPYGQSGDIPDLQQFSIGAVRQHLPKTIARNSDPNVGPIDFRIPTAAELARLEAFMNSIKLPANGDYDLFAMISAAVARGGNETSIINGALLFTDTEGTAKCFKCHSGPVLSDAVAELGGGNRTFNTGVEGLPINALFPEACLGGQPLPPEANRLREFNTPPLIGVSRTAPYFHNNAVVTLREAVAFYADIHFNASPAAMNPLVGEISLTPQEIDDITAFLTALVEPFVDCDNNTIDDRVQIAGGAADCNQNQILDSCELAEDDCNNNGVPDECDVAPAKLTAAQTFSIGAGGFHVTTADLDGDNDLDIIMAAWSAFDVRVLLNNGNGTAFTSGGNFPVASYTRCAAAADFDGDGDVDVAAANLFANHVSLLLNNGGDGMGGWLGFASAVNLPMNAGTIFVRAVDLNADGRPDLAAAKQLTNQVAVMLNLGPDGMGGWLGFAPAIDYALSGGTGPWGIDAARLNADASVDLVVADLTTDDVAVLMNDGMGAFGSAVRYAVGDAPESLVLADVNRDGAIDLAVANAETDTLSLFLNNGAGVFLTPQTITVGSYPFGAGPHAVIAADVDRDGAPELVTSNKETNTLTVLMNNGMGVFTEKINFPANAVPDYVTAADIDADGDLDAVTVHYSAQTVTVMKNLTLPYGGDCNGNGTPDSCDIAQGTSVDLNSNNLPDECELLGDVNADGIVNALDIDAFAAVLVGLDANPIHVERSDLNGDAARDGRDIGPFVVAYLAANGGG